MNTKPYKEKTQTPTAQVTLTRLPMYSYFTPVVFTCLSQRSVKRTRKNAEEERGTKVFFSNCRQRVENNLGQNSYIKDS